MTGVLVRQLWQQGSLTISGLPWNCSVIRSLLLHGSNPSAQDGVAQVPSLTFPFRNDREVDHAYILCLIRLCPNDHEVVLVRSLEHVHRLVESYRFMYVVSITRFLAY